MDPTPLLRLPFELFLRLFDHMAVQDILSVLAVCRQLQAYAKNERIYAALCARYGVYDTSCFPSPHNSFYAVYTGLLHAYAPLIGLWASDSPVYGSIIEISLAIDVGTDAQFPPGIVAEEWSFPMNRRAFDDFMSGPSATPHVNVVREPIRRPLLHISFDERTSQQPMTYESPIRSAKAVCYRNGLNEPHDAVISLPLEAQRQVVMHAQSGDIFHYPDLPHKNAGWLALTKSFNICKPFDTQSCRDEAEERNAIIVGMAGISFWDQIDILAEDAPLRRTVRYLTWMCECARNASYINGLNDRLVLPARYYPIRDDYMHLKQTHTDPSFGPILQPFHPAMFSGLWLGDHGKKWGTEVLWLEGPDNLTSKTDQTTVHAWKITGDGFIPRGAEEWFMNLSRPLEFESLNPESRAALTIPHHDLCNARCFSSFATLGADADTRTYEPMIPCTAVVYSFDHIRICWPTAQPQVREYRRYEPATSHTVPA
jgi:hypothetical protein